MRIIAKDTVTGETREINDPHATVFYLADGNGNCDYNRAHWFGVEDLPDDEHGTHVCHQGPDHRSFRFRIVEVLDWDGEDPVELDYLND